MNDSTTQPLKIASIGAGRRGQIVKMAHRPDEGVHLVGACDVLAKVRDEYRAEFGPDLLTTDDYRDILDIPGLDAVFVTSPDFLHEEHAVAALSRGIAVYLEKPMAITIEGCDRILDAAAKHHAKLYLGHNMRFFPVFRKMKELIDQGCIGEVQAVWCRHFVGHGGDYYFKDWHSERQYTTGLLLQKAAHDIDVIHWLAGAYTSRVCGMGKLSVFNQVEDRRDPGALGDPETDLKRWPPRKQSGMSPKIDVEDHSMVLMQLANGVQASYTQCHYTPDSHRNYTVIGTEGRIENIGDHSNDQIKASVRLWNQRIESISEHGSEEFVIDPIEGGHGGADPQIIDDFIHYLRTDERRGAKPMDARMSVAAGYLATSSLRDGNHGLAVPSYDQPR